MWKDRQWKTKRCPEKNWISFCKNNQDQQKILELQLTRSWSQFISEQTIWITEYYTLLVLFLTLMWKDNKWKPKRFPDKNMDLVLIKGQHPQRMMVPWLTWPQSQLNLEQSIQITGCHPPPPMLLSFWRGKITSKKPKDVQQNTWISICQRVNAHQG